MVDHVHPLMAEIVGKRVRRLMTGDSVVTRRISGAKAEEVCIMGTLTANLHLMLSQFYKPTSERYKLVCEAKAFPSDQVSRGGGRGADADGTVLVRFRVAGPEPRVRARGRDHRDWASGGGVLDQRRRYIGRHRETRGADRACPFRWPFIL